jgi:hypothetical protein
MAFVPEQAVWEPGVYQLEVQDGPAGGMDGIDNVPLRHAANRTKFLNTARVSGLLRGRDIKLGVSTIA